MPFLDSAPEVPWHKCLPHSGDPCYIPEVPAGDELSVGGTSGAESDQIPLSAYRIGPFTKRASPICGSGHWKHSTVRDWQRDQLGPDCHECNPSSN